ncbi:hypothetical protein SLEP1_g13668 [Rubroshorea leprosula]|uniref:Uncharacterized protein n=1 Tax=Rubroshorea leprosula TaxID=152421 RepID=A0AAV5IS37_9ROSI|nr:hypothetical protein SLEP1_g13668 [Rubroshorea leprosula]
MRTLRLCMAIAMLSLFALWHSVTAAPLVVSNIGKPGKMAYVTCDLNLSSQIAIGIAPGNQTSITFPHANSVLCVGTYNSYSHGYYHERPYVLYDSNKGVDNCKDTCLIRVTNFGFDSWNEKKKMWKAIYPIIHVV